VDHPTEPPLSILYRDEHLVAVDKPAGLLVHRTGLDAGETRFALQRLRDQLGQPVWPVHRLDKGTSGVLLFALDAGTARALGQRLHAGEEDPALEKLYLALVRGWPATSCRSPTGRFRPRARPWSRCGPRPGGATSCAVT
jgi:tRNA pseudouridine65 synthase